MPTYGIPCDDTPQPDQYFILIQQCDDQLAQFMLAVQQLLHEYDLESQAYINSVFASLQRSLDTRFGRIDGLIQQVYGDLLMLVTALLSTGNTALASAITSIAYTLQVPVEEVYEPGMPTPYAFPPGYGPAPGAAQPPQPPSAFYPFPGQLGAAPFPVPPLLPAQPALPGATGAVAGTGSLPAPAPPAVVVNLQVNGTPVNATQTCDAIPSEQVVNVAGVSYLPVFTVYSTDAPLPLGSDGNPIIQVHVDPQPDGTAVISVGPIAVQVSLPSLKPDGSGAACPVQINTVG